MYMVKRWEVRRHRVSVRDWML